MLQRHLLEQDFKRRVGQQNQMGFSHRLDACGTRELFQDARCLLQRMVDEELVTARGVYGFFPANGVGDDIELYTDESRRRAQPTIASRWEERSRSPESRSRTRIFS